MTAPSFFRRSHKERVKERTNDLASKHRKTMTVTQAVRTRTGVDVTKRRELYRVDLNLTKTPAWIKRRRNRAANRVARRARRVNQRQRRLRGA